MLQTKIRHNIEDFHSQRNSAAKDSTNIAHVMTCKTGIKVKPVDQSLKSLNSWWRLAEYSDLHLI